MNKQGHQTNAKNVFQGFVSESVDMFVSSH
jgi:hypothetical protein